MMQKTGLTETEERQKSSGIKTIIVTVISLVIVFIIYYSVMSAVAPAKKLAALKKEYQPAQVEGIVTDERIYSDSAYLKLLKEKAFLQSRIAMAQTDSIYLTLNLADSSANLEISGVVVHSAKLLNMRISKILRKGDEFIISSMLSVPFNITGDYATIKKEPLMIKMAPKDTSEYKPDIIPDTTDYEAVNYILDTDRGIRIYVYQIEENEFNDRSKLFSFDLNDRMRNTFNSLKKVAGFEVPEYHPFIKIQMTKSDAKIIYRAIPRNGQIAIYR